MQTLYAGFEIIGGVDQGDKETVALLDPTKLHNRLPFVAGQHETSLASKLVPAKLEVALLLTQGCVLTTVKIYGVRLEYSQPYV